MLVILTLLVRDEIDVIKGMIDYHLAHGVDHLIVTDNGSEDGTLEVLQEYASQGHLDLLTEPPADFSQHRWVSRMANLAYDKHGADWVINADADELFVAAPCHSDLKDALRQVAEDVSVLSVPRHDFIPTERHVHEVPQAEMIYRKAVSTNLRGEPLPPKVMHRGSPNTRISQGNHAVTGDLLGSPVETQALSVFHYPIRSYQQFYRKVLNGGSGYAINTDLDPGEGFHKRYWYDLLTKGELLKEFERHLMSPSERRAALHMGEIVEETRASLFFRQRNDAGGTIISKLCRILRIGHSKARMPAGNGR